MALGLKRNETRGWSTQFRGDIAICAALRKMTEPDRLFFDAWVEPAGGVVAYGCIVCVVTVVACVPSLDYTPATKQEGALGNYDSGRYVWVTENLRRLKTPVPWKGRQGFFSIPDNIITEALL
jgi:hypothetical protein